ncbi:MAG: guanylate kinase [Myxococcota bacterium]
MTHEEAPVPGLLLAFVGPSGVGKSSLCAFLLDACPNLNLSISYTTRQPRGRERNGVAYHFVDEETFMAMVSRGEFIEYARVHGNLYGTAVEVVRRARGSGQDLLFDIDYQGASQLKNAFPDAIAIMIAPPNMTVLETRLRGRSTDSEETIAARLAFARTELSQVDGFDYIIVNGDFDRACQDALSIYRAQQLVLHRQRSFVTEQLLS